MRQKDADVPQQNDFNQEEVLDEQQFLDQERNFIVVQVEADCSHIKEEQEDVYISQEGEQFGLKQEPQTFQDAQWLHDCKVEEVLTVQQLCNQERKFSLDQEEQDATQVKEEEEELCTSQEEEHFGLKQETDTFMVTPTDEDNDKSEAVPNSELLLSHNSPDTESQDQGADALWLHDFKEEEEVLTVQQLCNQERKFSRDQEEQDAAQVKEEEEELCTSQEEEHFGPKQETDTFMTPTDEDNDKSITRSFSQQLVKQAEPVA
ncbi:uncharacterized protein KZ484_011992 [Pholidichthys leucotaenia]